MKWIIYIRYALSGTYKFNFVGNKEKLMTLIGVIHSISIEECRVDYKEVKDVDLALSEINYVITPNKIYTRVKEVQ